MFVRARVHPDRVVDSVASTPDPQPALVWRRVAARATDLATVLFVQWALTILHIFWFVDAASTRYQPAPWGRAFVSVVLFVTLSAVYEVVFVRWNAGRTPGKDVWRIKIVTAGTDDRPGVPRALARWAGPGLTILLWPIGLALTALAAWGLTVPVTVGRRAVHDLVTGTAVVVDQRDDEVETEDVA
jgi:uncharacterized RDD family membrane protein YckC